MRGKNYQYISTVPYNATTDYIMGDKRISAFGAPNMIAYNTWEKNRTLDFGVDIAALNNRLTMSFDWYRRDIIGLITGLGTDTRMERPVLAGIQIIQLQCIVQSFRLPRNCFEIFKSQGADI